MEVTVSPLLRPLVESLDESLERIARTGDADGLRSLLLGRGLPVLGGDAEPVEVLMRALGPSQAPAGLAQVLGAVLAAEVAGLTQEGATPDRRMLLRGALRLAAELPPQANLFRALQTLASSLEEKVEDLWSGDALGPLIARALAYQQTDGAMEDSWLHLLRMSNHKAWTPERRTVLLMAWRGLLRISPSKETRSNGKVVDFDRIERGLRALYAGVRETEGGARLIRLALDVLAETFPRSPQFWEDGFGARVVRWPAELREEAVRKWPGLRTSETRKPKGLSALRREPQKVAATGFLGRANLDDRRYGLEVANNTTTDTQYRTGTNNPTISDGSRSAWISIKAGDSVVLPAPPCPFKLEFMVNGEIVYSRVCDKPLDSVQLSLAREKLQVRRRFKRVLNAPEKYPEESTRYSRETAKYEKSPKQSQKPPLPSRRPTA